MLYHTKDFLYLTQLSFITADYKDYKDFLDPLHCNYIENYFTPRRHMIEMTERKKLKQ